MYLRIISTSWQKDAKWGASYHIFQNNDIDMIITRISDLISSIL